MEAQYCVPFLIVQQNNAKQGNRPQILATNLVPQNCTVSSPPSLVGHTHILEGHSSHVAHPLAATAPELGQLTLVDITNACIWLKVIRIPDNTNKLRRVPWCSLY